MADNTEDINKIYVGDVGLAIVLMLAKPGESIDITGATDTKMLVKKPDGTVVEWDADILTVAGETKYLRHFTVAGDLDQKGRYRIQAYLSISGWTGRGETATFKVYDAFK